ncbi:MAG: sugar ABC transporter ATP-binding protein [Ginsengibacter sp.]
MESIINDVPVLKLEKITKSFSGVKVLDEVNLLVNPGEVHALMGENGAGKSTLMKILSGVHSKESGSIFFKNKLVNIENPRAAINLGISMIHQELNSIMELTVSENIFLGNEPVYKFLKLINRRKQNKIVASLFSDLGVNISPDKKMKDISISERQIVEIVKAISFNSSVIIMDEPTSALMEKEVKKLFEVIKKLKSKGVSFIYISHKMEEIFQIADTITVLRDGRTIDTKPIKDIDYKTLVRLMVGREIEDLFYKQDRKIGSMCFEVENLTKPGLSDISFKLHKGEILGFAGLMGSGRTEIMETIFGLSGSYKGLIKRNGKVVKIKSPQDAIAHKIALIPEDRKLQGLNLKGSVKTNVTTLVLKKFCFLQQIISLNTEDKFAQNEIEKFRIKVSNKQQPVETLSGGNQQKVVLAKWLSLNPEVIIFDEPTRGIDIGAKAEIYKIIGQEVNKGNAVILVSSELPEILGLCDRVIVLNQGKISAEFPGEGLSEENIMAAAMDYK